MNFLNSLVPKILSNHMGSGTRSFRNEGNKSPVLSLFCFLSTITSLASICLIEPQVNTAPWVHRSTSRPDPTSGQTWKQNFTARFALLLAFAEWLKKSVGCGRAHLQSLACRPLSAPHYAGHQIPQALRDVYFCVL